MKKTALFLIVIIALPNLLSAQQRTHMPYSVYGLGDLVPKGFSHNMAMGRTGIALSSPRYLNNLNPASYHLIDSVSFFFDFGLSSKFVNYRTNINPAQHGNDFNIANLAIGFGITKNWSASIGLAPYSSVGYRIRTLRTIQGSPTEEYEVEINGNGGLNQFYWNNSYELFKHISLGVNLTYLFGSIESAESLSTTTAGTILINDASYLKRLYADFGLQAYFSPAKNWDLTIGGIFGKNHNINITNNITVTDGNGTVSEEEVTGESKFRIPLYLGGGLSVSYKKSLTISADYIYYDWSSTHSENTNYKYRSNNILRLGAEFIPGRYSTLGYFGGIAYRAGVFYEESYLELRNRLIPDYGITAGVGLPFMQNRTSINISYNYGIKGTLENNLVRENYHSIMLSLTMHDWWFLKRKID